MTINEIAHNLCDGLSYSENEISFIVNRLNEIKNEDNVSNEELDEMCWKDSNAMFDRIFG